MPLVNLMIKSKVQCTARAAPHKSVHDGLTVIQVASEDTLETAYIWVCNLRESSSHNNSVWHLRRNKEKMLFNLRQQLLRGQYQFSPLRSYHINGEHLSCWEASDALVLKAISMTLQPLFSPEKNQHCTHLKNAGGIHGAIKQVSANKSHYQKILKSDVWHYYESIDHDILLSHVAQLTDCKILLNLVMQYCQRLEIRDGEYYHFTRGIPKGCPLSPLMGALYLKPLDDALSTHGFYVRYMDDWVVMVKTKRQLRKVIKLTYKILKQLKLKMHPDKTFLGCIKKGFDFLGVHFGDTPEISKPSLEKHRNNIARRYAQGASNLCIGRYIKRWTSWCNGLLKCCGDTSRLEIHGTNSVVQQVSSVNLNLENHHEKMYPNSRYRNRV